MTTLNNLWYGLHNINQTIYELYNIAYLGGYTDCSYLKLSWIAFIGMTEAYVKYLLYLTFSFWDLT